MPKGLPGITSVAFIKLDPKSNPMRSALADIGPLLRARMKAVRIETLKKD